MDSVKVFCNNCKTVTNHGVAASHKLNDTSEYEDFDEDGSRIIVSQLISSNEYQIVFCHGCESPSYRTLEWWNGMGDIAPTYYPQRNFELPSVVSNTQYSAKSLLDVPPHIRKIYEEVVQAYNANLPMLCASGLRAIVEGTCKHFNVSGKSLHYKIEALGTGNLISNELATALRAHKRLGEDALHSLIVAEKDELHLAISLIETTLDVLFSVPKRHSDLKDKLTKRYLE